MRRRCDQACSDCARPADWDSSDIAALRGFGGLVAEVLGAALAAHQHSALAGQLQYALDYRVVIERAVGYLMGAHCLDAVAAFNLLRKQARDSRRRVADVAADVLGGTAGPSEDLRGAHHDPDVRRLTSPESAGPAGPGS